ncbi:MULTISPECIES: D-alanyl-D-alanine carboxypeptidase family protein [Bacillaceae]|uniref:D-alanyl-D-alanine carboxypeptidase n=1 Tax=Evansella alkalicola TaxID=745819 RepID=A0ABS6JZI7_9BACI|nr:MULTISPECIES: D-alanyl-D-alanine carboxypeptidase family protein [Bacillaceae]MBU9724010.1 D-alanyl-D-alanine carboxypeptidase [Bacillus alkalicola]
MIKRTLKLTMIFILVFNILPNYSDAATFPGDVSARGSILIEQESGRVLFEKQAHTPMRIASITKIMTAILAIESGQLDEWVTVSKNAEGTEGSSLYLVAGEKIKLRDLVYGLMLRSGNDSAVAIAEHVGGSLEGFVTMMNQKREELGMINSAFANPHGLDDHEEHYSTAYDMAILTKYALELDEYREIASTKSYTSKNKAGSVRSWHNKNRLLTQLYKHSTGGKTGYTKRAKRTLVSTANKDEMDLIAVTINAPSDWNDHISLFEWGFNTFKHSTLVKQGVIEVEDEFYQEKITAEYSFEYPLAEEEVELIDRKVVLYRPPNDDKWEREDPPYPIGTIQLELGEELIGVVPLKYIGEDEEAPPFWKKWLDHLFMVIGVKNSG